MGRCPMNGFDLFISSNSLTNDAPESLKVGCSGSESDIKIDSRDKSGIIFTKMRMSSKARSVLWSEVRPTFMTRALTVQGVEALQDTTQMTNGYILCESLRSL